jgi:microsomal prostaglandin-E synthase 2
MLATKQILSTGKGLAARSTVRRVGALRAFGLTLTSVAAVPSSSSCQSVTKKDRYLSTAAASAASSLNLQVPADPSITLYQYQICPFCNTAKAVLAYANVPYEAVEVNPLTKDELKWYVDNL